MDCRAARSPTAATKASPAAVQRGDARDRRSGGIVGTHAGDMIGERSHLRSRWRRRRRHRIKMIHPRTRRLASIIGGGGVRGALHLTCQPGEAVRVTGCPAREQADGCPVVPCLGPGPRRARQGNEQSTGLFTARQTAAAAGLLYFTPEVPCRPAPAARPRGRRKRDAGPGQGLALASEVKGEGWAKHGPEDRRAAAACRPWRAADERRCGAALSAPESHGDRMRVRRARPARLPSVLPLRAPSWLRRDRSGNCGFWPASSLTVRIWIFGAAVVGFVIILPRPLPLTISWSVWRA